MKKYVLFIALIISFFMKMPVDAKENSEGLNYLYINEAEQSEGNCQSIVVSWGDGSREIKEVELGIKNESDETIVLSGSINENKIFVFQKGFEKGVYCIDYLVLKTEGIEKSFYMEDQGICASFSVGIEQSNLEKSTHQKMDSLITANQEIENLVVTINEENIEDASEIVTEGLTDLPAVNRAKARSKEDNIVVVLDPGHDSTHSGASGNGVIEHKATWEIAKYCKKELEKYDNVTVYLTRETESCPFPGTKDNIDDIKQRVKWADKKGADAFVSIHLNAAGATAAKGAEVFYSASSSSGKGIAQKVQDELTALGLYDRGIKVNEDYAVIKTSQKYGFPGIIIEHGFITNSSDALKYLKTDKGLEKLGKADATGIAEYFKLQKSGTKVTMAEAAYTISNLATEDLVLSITEEIIESGGVEENDTTEKSVSVCMKKHQKLSTQRFEVIEAGDKWYYLEGEKSGKVIGITEGVVQEETLNNSKTQKWSFIAAGNDRYYLRSQSGKYLAVSDGKVVCEKEKSSKTQRWTFTKATYRSVKNLTPKLVSVKNKNGSVEVKWKQLTGATGYYVCRKLAEDTKWKKIGNVKSGAETTYVDSKVESNTKYMYSIKAYKGEIESLFDKKGLSITTPKKYVEYSTISAVNYRKGPGTSYSQIGRLSKGTVVYVEENYSKIVGNNKWYRIKLNKDSTKIYYICAKYLVKGIAEVYETYKTTTRLNYRSGAGTSCIVKGTLEKGVKVSVVKGWSKTADGYKWYKIKRNGNYYYTAAKYLVK